MPNDTSTTTGEQVDEEFDEEPQGCQAEPMWLGVTCGDTEIDDSGFCDAHREVDDPDRGRDLREER